MPTRFFALVLVGAALAAPAAAQGPPTTLTLTEALARARTNAPALLAVRARLDAARDAAPRAGRPVNPLIEVRSENWASGAPGGLPLDVFATVTQTVELGGKRGARRAVATAAVQSAAVAEALVWREIAGQVIADYLAALRARDEVRALDAHRLRLGEAIRVVARRVEVGTAPEMELLKLRTEDARALVDRTRAELGAARAVATLGAALGTDVRPGDLARPTVPLAPLHVVDTHPELVAAAAAIDTAQASVTLERTRGVPDVAVNAGVKRTAGYTTGVAAVTVPVPLFDANGVARAVAHGQLRAAQLERDAVARRLDGLMAATTAAATTLAARAADIQVQLVEPARLARDAASAAFAAGALDVLRLVDAERMYVDATLAAIALDIEAAAAAIEMRRAAGEDLP